MIARRLPCTETRIIPHQPRLPQVNPGMAAALLEQFPPPKSFETFPEHATLLRLHWEQGTNASEIAHIIFPPELDVDIPDPITRLWQGLDPKGRTAQRQPDVPDSSVTTKAGRQPWRGAPQ
jgi:hypothetical protein